MIQDTSFIIDVLRGEENATDLLGIIKSEPRPQKVSSVTVLELYESVVRSEVPKKKRERVTDVLESKSVIDASSPGT